MDSEWLSQVIDINTRLGMLEERMDALETTVDSLEAALRDFGFKATIAAVGFAGAALLLAANLVLGVLR